MIHALLLRFLHWQALEGVLEKEKSTAVRQAYAQLLLPLNTVMWPLTAA